VSPSDGADLGEHRHRRQPGGVDVQGREALGGERCQDRARLAGLADLDQEQRQGADPARHRRIELQHRPQCRADLGEAALLAAQQEQLPGLKLRR
jgi:hypothetical protein